MIEPANRLLGVSAAIQHLEREIECAARCDAKILITGESGVGKEVLARMIHDRSLRRQRRLLAINCAGLPDSLLESELFGHTRGSFTGAFRDKPGLVEVANGSTLFMDEVGEMSLRMQAVLLRFLETGETQRIGSDRPQGRVDVRVIAATNCNLAERIAAGAFREDLFFRLNVLSLTIPPLRERPEDIPVLLGHFLDVFSAERGIAPPRLGPGVVERLLDHTWPGNVRELRNVLERAVLRLDEAGVITLADLPAQIVPAPPPPPVPSRPVQSVIDCLFQRMAAGDQSFWTVVYEPFMARDLTRSDVREIIRLGLEQSRGSYRILVQLFNMPPTDYKRFLNFLRAFECQLPYHGFRTPAVKQPSPPPIPRAAGVRLASA